VRTGRELPREDLVELRIGVRRERHTGEESTVPERFVRSVGESRAEPAFDTPQGERNMTIRLHGVPGTRSTRAAWLLEELGVPYEQTSIKLAEGEHKQAPHLARQPHGLVPAIDLGHGPMIESAAMCLALADLYADKGLAPSPSSPDRARYYEAIVYAVSTLDETVIPMYLHTKVFPPEQRDPKIIEAKRPTWKIAADLLTTRLGSRQFIVGDKLSAADFVVGYDLVLALEIGLLAGYPELAAYTKRLIERPSFRKVFPS
jgi:glutathione S-transferase